MDNNTNPGEAEADTNADTRALEDDLKSALLRYTATPVAPVFISLAIVVSMVPIL